MKQVKNTLLILIALTITLSRLSGQIIPPANVTVNSTPGMCGAMVQIPNATAPSLSSFTSSTVYTMNFDACVLPAGWSTLTLGSGGSTGIATSCSGIGASMGNWLYSFVCTNNNPFAGSATNGFSGCRAIISDDDATSLFNGAAAIVSPVIGVAPVAGKSYELEFAYDFVDLSTASTYVEMSNNGTTWTKIWELTTTGSGIAKVPVANYTATTQFRFVHNDGGNNWAWGVAFDGIKLNELTPVTAVISNNFNGSNTGASGQYPVGTTIITYTLVGVNPPVTATSTVTVVDNEAPKINCPANATIVLNPGECTALIPYNVTSSDNCPFVGSSVTTANAGSASSFENSFSSITFDLRNSGTNPIKITGMNVNLAPGVQPVAIYRTALGSTASAAGFTGGANWTQITTPGTTVNSSASAWFDVTFVDIPASGEFILNPGQTVGIWVSGDDIRYSNGNQVTTSGSIQIISNNHEAGFAYPGPLNIAPRLFKGSIQYAELLPSPPVTLTAGLPSGAEFPKGKTTNTYSVTDNAGNKATCSFSYTVQDYPSPITALACNDLVNISLGENCEVIVDADMILEGGPYKCYADYIVTVTGGGNKITKPGTYTVTVTDPATGNKCWGKILAEDKLAPKIICGDLNVNCIEPIIAAPQPAFSGVQSLVKSPINIEGGPISTAATLSLNVPSYIPGNVTDLNVSIDISTAWPGDLNIALEAPDGTTSILWNNYCGFAPGGLRFVVDDEGTESDNCFDYSTGANLKLTGFIPIPALSVFDGKPYTGTWKVRVWDNFNDAGVDATINEIELRFAGLNYPSTFPKGQCGEDLTWTYTDNEIDNGCDGKVIRRTWIAKDPSGNATSCVQFISVSNITLADVSLPPALVEMNSCGAGTTPADVAAFFDVDSRTGPGIGGYNDDWTEAQGSPAGVVELNEGFAIAYPHYFAVGRDGKLHAQKIDNTVCSIVATYSDQIINACGQGCPGNSKVIRTWTLLDWCTLQQATYVQVIKAVDQKAPTFIVKDVTVSVSPWGCIANFDIPMPWELQDNCDAHPKWSIEGPAGVVITGNSKDGYKASGAPKGVHKFTYKAVDCCGNVSTQTITITVIDRSAPVAVAKQNIVISLTGSGTANDGAAKLFGRNVDNGSYDHCSDVKLELRRPDGAPSCGNEGIDGHNNNVTFNNNTESVPNRRWAHPEDNANDTDNGEFVKFCCEDLGGQESKDHQVILRVWDDGNMNGIIGDNLIIDGMQDNYNETWADIKVEDKLAPVIVCPPDATVTCDMDLQISTTWKNVDDVVLQTGEATAYALCAGVPVEYKDTPSFTNSCENVGTVIRDFRARKGNKVVTCRQRIKVNALPSTFVVTPPSTSVIDTDCDFNASKIKASDKPKVQSGPCDVIGENINIQEFEFEDGVCKKWKVTYNYINWCTNEQKGPFTKFYKYKDDEKPVLTCKDQMFGANPNPQNPNGACEGAANLEASATDGGGCTNNGWLKWIVFVDLWGNGTIDYEFSSYLPTTDNNLNNDTNGNGIRDRYLAPTSSGQTVKVPSFILEAEMSSHKVSWKVTDGCGNFTSCESTFMVVDKKAPTPYCVSLSSALMQNGQVELWAIDFNKGSFDNCTAQNSLAFTFDQEMPVWTKLGEVHYFKGQGQLATLAEYNLGKAQKWVPEFRSSARIFTQTGTIPIKMSVWDAKGNTDFCVVELKLIDNNGAGSRVAGQLLTKNEEPINKVSVSINANISEFPKFGTFDGVYAFNNLINNTYTITPSKTDDYLNGVSTLDLVLIQRHILGIAKLNSPEKLIAADINKDSKVNSADLVELRRLILGMTSKLANNDSWAFVPKSYVYPDPSNPYSAPRILTLDVNAPINNADFTGIKIGDVNNDASAFGGNGINNRTSNSLKFIIEDKEVQKGELVNVAISSSNFRNVFGYQFTASTTGLDFVNMISGATKVDDSFGVPADNKLTMSWSNEDGLSIANDEVLFTIVFRATENGLLSNMINLNSDVTKIESYLGNEMENNGVSMEFRTNNSITDTYEVYQNEPNPFKNETVISFRLPEASKVTISLTDVTGKLISFREIDGIKGLNRVEYSKNDVSSLGLIYYTVTAGDFSDTKAMIVIE